MKLLHALPPAPLPPRRRILAVAGALGTTLVVGGCAAFGHDQLRVHVAGFAPLTGEGLELRFAVRLRLQNPNDAPVVYDGVSLELEVNGQPLASGVSDRSGSVPRYGEAVLSVPVTVSAFSVVRQALGLAAGETLDEVPYLLRGKLAGPMPGGVRFSERGSLNLARLGSGRR